MAEQKIFPQQIDTTGSTNGQVLVSNGSVATWTSGSYTGSQGYYGSVGYSGSAGYTGSASTVIGYWGSTGYTGSRGTDGVIGYWGSVGYSGSVGAQGYWGSTGYTGSRGTDGVIGYWGSVGYSGSVGSQGYWGSVGYSGSVGAQGYWGSTGYSGSVGSLGYWGSVGYTGSRGTDGVIGYWGSTGYTGSTGAGYTGSQGTTAILYTSETAPSSPVAGTFWYKTDEATLYVYYNDGDSNQWVGVTAAGSTGYTGSSGGGGGGNGYTGSIGYSGSSGSASLTSVRQQFTGDGSTTSFAVAGGYTPNAISVFVNGVLLRNGTEVTVTNGSTVVFAIAPLSGALIDVIGTVPTTYSSITPVSYSVGFNGSSQYLTVPANAAFSLTGDFTIEAWVYLTTATGTKCIFTNRSTIGAAGIAWTTASGSQALSIYTNSGFSATSSSSIPLNTWTHVALTRSGSTITQWLNGVNVGTVTNSSSFTEALCFIGSNNSGTENWPGYISNFRLVKGVAVYTNNFTVPSSPLQAVQSASGAYIQAITGTQTSLLTCNAPTIIDGSTNAFTITNTGSTPVSTAIVPTFTNVTIVKKAQTQTILTSGSGTYTTPAGVVSLKIRMVGGGGGGGGGSTTGSPGSGGSNGTNTTFGTSFLTAGYGLGASTGSALASLGGTATIGSGAVGITITGGGGSAGQYAAYPLSGAGGNSAFGGGASGGGGTGGLYTSGVGATNSGAGGGGGISASGATVWAGHGGSAGAYIEAYISSPAASYAYAVGAGGGGGAAGNAGGSNGGAGGSGLIIIEENY